MCPLIVVSLRCGTAASAPPAALAQPAPVSVLENLLEKEREQAAQLLGKSDGSFAAELAQAVNTAIANSSPFDLAKMSAHEKGCSRQMQKFWAFLEKHPDVFGNLMQPVQIAPGSSVPKIAFIHKVSRGKEIINAALTFYVTKSLIYCERPAPDGCPYRELSTITTYLKQVFSEGKNKYGWNWSLEKDFNRSGGFINRLNNISADIKGDQPVCKVCEGVLCLLI